MPYIRYYTSNVVVSNVATALTASSVLCREVLVQVDPILSAGITVRIGDASGQFVVLSAMGNVTLPASAVSNIFAIASGGSATINWLAHTDYLP